MIRLRQGGSLVAAVLGCLLAIVSVVTVWARAQVLDTDRYLATVAPLASSRVVQDDVAARVTTAIDRRLDALPRHVGAAVHRLVADQAQEIVRSEAFHALWVSANRVGHSQLVHALTGEDQGVVSTDSGRLTLDLGPVVQAVRDRLVQAGVKVVGLLPPITLVVDLGDARRLETARTVVRRLDRAAFWLPVGTLALLGAAVALAGRRRRAVALACAGVAVAMLVLLLAVRLGSGPVTHRLATSAGSAELVRELYRHLTAGLVRGTVVVAAVAALAAVVAGLLGLSRRPREVG